MKRYHGKPVDPRQFKGQTLSNLMEKSEFHEELSGQFLEEASLEVDACPICGSTERTVAVEQSGRNYSECSTCSHVYQSRILTEERFVEFYEESSEYATTYTHPEQIEYRLENITKPKIDFVRDRIDVSGERWLDVGSGVGTSVQYLESLGWDAVGLEVSEETVAAAEELLGVSLTQQTLSEYFDENPDAEFDVVTMFGYLDLVPNPIADLKLVREHLSDGGWIAIHVPQFESVTRLVQQSFDYEPFRYLTWNILHVFTIDSIETAFERVGFAPKAAWFYGLDLYELVNALSLTVEGFENTPLQEYLLENFNEFQAVVDDHEMSDYVTVVGQKTE